MEQKEQKTNEDILKILAIHFEDDRKNFAAITEFHRRMEPVLKVFEDNKIVSMKLKNDTNTLLLYGQTVLTAGAILAGLWAIIKFIIKP